MISIPRNTIIRSRAAASVIMPDSREQQQDVRFTGRDSLPRVVIHRQRDRADRREKEDDVGGPAEIVDGNDSGQRGIRTRDVVADRNDHRDAKDDARNADAAAGALRSPAAMHDQSSRSIAPPISRRSGPVRS